MKRVVASIVETQVQGDGVGPAPRVAEGVVDGADAWGLDTRIHLGVQEDVLLRVTLVVFVHGAAVGIVQQDAHNVANGVGAGGVGVGDIGPSLGIGVRAGVKRVKGLVGGDGCRDVLDLDVGLGHLALGPHVGQHVASLLPLAAPEWVVDLSTVP